MALKQNIQTKLSKEITRRLTPAEQIGLGTTIHPYLSETLELHRIADHSDDAAKQAADAKRARRAERNLRNAR